MEITRRVKRSRRVRAAGRSRPVCLPAVGARGAREEHANKLALYLKQLLGIAVTHGPEDRGPYCPAKRPGEREERRRMGEEGASVR